MKKTSFTILFSLMVLFLFMATLQAQTPQETLKQYISSLQKKPNDYALREQIIKHVQTMATKPIIPEEAERYMARGAAAMKGGKSEKDFQDAASEFEKATLVVPWLPEAYYNLGVTQDKAGRYKEAIQSLKFYLLAAPDAPDAKAVKKLIYEIEYRQEKVAKESSPEAIAAKKQKEEEESIRKLNGVRYVTDWSTRSQSGVTALDVQGSKIIMGLICYRGCEGGIYAGGGWHYDKETTLNGREFSFTNNCQTRSGVVRRVFIGRISEDGNSISLEDCVGPQTFRRQR